MNPGVGSTGTRACTVGMATASTGVGRRAPAVDATGAGADNGRGTGGGAAGLAVAGRGSTPTTTALAARIATSPVAAAVARPQGWTDAGRRCTPTAGALRTNGTSVRSTQTTSW